MSCSTLVQAAAASCWVVGSSTAAAVPPSLLAAARHEVLDFFLAAFDDIDPNAVPITVHDDLYARSWCNSAMRTAGGCWAPPSPAAHRSLPGVSR